ncbi:MAG: hypothetical protein H6P98_1181 [Candidatus Aminicenantes bacterium]|nr:hypothetical protein [Candidatus Aminicenantes bacterium]
MGPPDEVVFLDEVALPEEDGADALLLEIQGQAEDIAGKLEKLVVHDPVEAVDAGDPVAHRGDGPDLADIDLRFVALDPLLNDPGDFIGLDVHGASYPSEIFCLILSRWPRREAS